MVRASSELQLLIAGGMAALTGVVAFVVGYVVKWSFAGPTMVLTMVATVTMFVARRLPTTTWKQRAALGAGIAAMAWLAFAPLFLVHGWQVFVHDCEVCDSHEEAVIDGLSWAVPLTIVMALPAGLLSIVAALVVRPQLPRIY